MVNQQTAQHFLQYESNLESPLRAGRKSQELTMDILAMMVSFFRHCRPKMLRYSCASIDKYCHKFSEIADPE